jgi:transcription antitermination factor NusG
MAVQQLSLAALAGAAAHLEPQWYAAHTRARHEKRIAEQLASRNIDYFLPLYKAAHRWKDRVAELELPLFPGYIFVHVALQRRRDLWQIPSIVKLVGFNGLPAPLPASEIESLRAGLAAQLKTVPLPYLKVGRRVRVKNGPLMGAEGILLRKKDKFRIVLSIDIIRRSVAVELDAADVEPLR